MHFGLFLLIVTFIFTFQLSFLSQRKAMPENAQTIAQLCSFHILVSLFSKSFKLGFISMWTKNFQMYKLGFEEAEETEIRLPSFVGSWRKQEKTSTSASLTALKPLTVWITTNCGKFLKRWEYQTILPVSCKVSMQVTKQVRTGRGATHWLRIGKVGWQGCIL